jgi:hypothetical protein
MISAPLKTSMKNAFIAIFQQNNVQVGVPSLVVAIKNEVLWGL